MLNYSGICANFKEGKAVFSFFLKLAYNIILTLSILFRILHIYVMKAICTLFTTKFYTLINYLHVYYRIIRVNCIQRPLKKKNEYLLKKDYSVFNFLNKIKK